MEPRKLSLVVIFLIVFLLSGCVAMQVAREVESGRAALRLGNPKAAIPHLAAAARLDPNYVTNFTLLQIGIWSYIGRAYYEAGDRAAALENFKRALERHGGDDYARMYLGLLMAENGARAQGITELEAGLGGLRAWLQNLPGVDTLYWDPGQYLYRKIGETQNLLKAEPINLTEIADNVRWLGQQFDEEIDQARRRRELQERRQGRGVSPR